MSQTHYSYTRLSAYEECPRKYKFRYVDHIEGPPQEPLQFGRAVHELCEELVREHLAAGCNGMLPRDRAEALWREAFVKNGLSGAAVYAEGLRILHAFIADEGPLEPRSVLAVEQPFTINCGGLILRGTIDRVNRPAPDTIQVVDYKTSRLVTSAAEADEDLQLSIYCLAAHQLYPWARNIRLTLHFLRHGAKVTTERTPERLQMVHEYLHALVRLMESDTDFEPRMSGNCPSCAYRDSCDAYVRAITGDVEVDRADPSDLEAAAEERESVSALAKVYASRQRELDQLLKKRLDQVDSLELGDREYRILNTARKSYPRAATLEALAHATGMEPAELGEQLLAVDKTQLDRLLASLKARLPRSDFKLLQLDLDNLAEKSISPRIWSSKRRRRAA